MLAAESPPKTAGSRHFDDEIARLIGGVATATGHGERLRRRNAAPHVEREPGPGERDEAIEPDLRRFRPALAHVDDPMRTKGTIGSSTDSLQQPLAGLRPDTKLQENLRLSVFGPKSHGLHCWMPAVVPGIGRADQNAVFRFQ
jgi:hypothetical protein